MVGFYFEKIFCLKDYPFNTCFSGRIVSASSIRQTKSHDPKMEEMNIGFVIVNLNSTGSSLPDWW